MRTSSAEVIVRIERLILARGARPGERIGNERELAETLQIPRTALRAALHEMESKGRIRRTMGRTGGVFASDGKIERQLNTTLSVPAMLRQQGIHAATTVLKVGLTGASASEARALQLDAGAPVVRIVRRRDADGAPWSIDTSVIPASLVPGITGRDLSGSLYEVLDRDYGLIVGVADETIDVVPAAPEVSSELQLPPEGAVLQVWRTAWTPDGVVLEFAHDLFRADRTRVHLRRHGAGWKRSAAG